MSSPIMAGEDGAPLAGMGQGFEFGIDPTEDPELAMVRTCIHIHTQEFSFRTFQPFHCVYSIFLLSLHNRRLFVCRWRSSVRDKRMKRGGFSRSPYKRALKVGGQF
jgi:hypothetical protein